MSLAKLTRCSISKQFAPHCLSQLVTPNRITAWTCVELPFRACHSERPLIRWVNTSANLCASEQGQHQPSGNFRSTGQGLPQVSPPASRSTNPEEIRKFAKLANEWWNPHGAFRPLHAMNPVRCKFLRDVLCLSFKIDPVQAEPFKDLSFLDVGCGGGILTEALARMGAKVTGIEPQHDNISAAIAHAQADPVVAERTTYLAVTAEELASSGTQFDAVMGLEIIEHVDEPQQFLKTLGSLTKSDGALFISTINRTLRGYALAILGAEQLTGVVPKGTHDWNKFLTPEELCMLTEGTGLELEQLAGMVLNPWSGTWALSTSTEVNYIAYFSKVSLADRLQQKQQPGLNSKAANLASA
ncbi:TPA: Hexaprenyldihydroxybenzoate methyltransferase, mitochondrial [Trebouxia sp. C0006]